MGRDPVRNCTVPVELVPVQSHLWTHEKMLSAVRIATALLHLFISNNDLQKRTQSFLICFVYPVMNMNDGMNIDKRWCWLARGMNIDEGFSSLQLMVLRAPSGTNQSSCSEHVNDRPSFLWCLPCALQSSRRWIIETNLQQLEESSDRCSVVLLGAFAMPPAI